MIDSAFQLIVGVMCIVFCGWILETLFFGDDDDGN